MAINGDVLILAFYDADNTTYRPAACLTSNSVNETTNVRESITKCNPGETIKSKGTRNYNISLEGEYIDTTSVGGQTTLASHDYIKTLAEGEDNIIWRMATGLADTPFYYGEGIITDLSLTAPANENATFSATLDGSGAIVTVDPTI